MNFSKSILCTAPGWIITLAAASLALIAHEGAEAAEGQQQMDAAASELLP